MDLEALISELFNGANTAENAVVKPSFDVIETSLSGNMELSEMQARKI